MYTDILSQIDFLHPNLWEFVIDSGDSEVPLKYLCKSVTFQPLTNFDTENSTVGINIYTGKTNPSEITLTFQETEALDILRYYNDWVSSFYDKEQRRWISGVNPKKSATILLTKFNEIGSEISIASWTLNGMMPKSLADFTLDYENDSGLDLSITVTVEDIKFIEKGGLVISTNTPSISQTIFNLF